ncbi:hypothetical protein HUJ04_007436 [Dendroctonus ponderosae]|nr:hypothetical protein HUJ04_007436 [Dendroctonus ponderosae]
MGKETDNLKNLQKLKGMAYRSAALYRSNLFCLCGLHNHSYENNNAEVGVKSISYKEREKNQPPIIIIKLYVGIEFHSQHYSESQ